MKLLAVSMLAVLSVGPAMAESYSTVSQYDVIRNHATHEAAENIILTGRIISTHVERGIHTFAVAFEDHLFNCVTPWDSFSHCRSESSEPLFDIRD